MEPIQGLERLAQLVRKKTDKNAEAGRTSKPADKAATEQPSSPISLAQFEQDLRGHIRQLQREGASQQALGRLVLQSILAREYSAELRNEAKFVALVQQVHRHIESEPGLKDAFERVVAQLAR